MINNVVLVGRLVRDPEMRYTQNGVAVTRFRIAVDRPSPRDEAGNRQTDFIDIVTWRKTAELCGQYLAKGAPVGIEGRIQTGTYTTSDGQQRQRFEVQAYRVSFLESRADRERREAARGPSETVPPEEAVPDTGPVWDETMEPPEPDDPFGDQ